MGGKVYVSLAAVKDLIKQVKAGPILVETETGYKYIENPADILIEEIEAIQDFIYAVDDPSRDIAPTPKQSSNRPENLSDTVTLMTSSDYKYRFKAEYYQTKIRYLSLCDTIVKYEAGTLDFLPIEILKDQAKHMGQYLFALEVRAKMEGIAL